MIKRFHIYNLSVMNKVESAHGIKIAKALGYGTDNQIFIIYLSKINCFLQADAPVFSSQAEKGDSRRIK